jgi:hypothetical protein
LQRKLAKQNEVGVGVQIHRRLVDRLLLRILNLSLSLPEIVAEVSTAKKEASKVGDSEAMDTEELEVDEPLITRQEAQSALNLVRRYVEKNFADADILKHSDALDEAFYQERKQKEKQSQLTQFFPVV